ncbi:hypothetical protein CSHISOI_10507 [Colletotrichum shisoi]|uniref:Heterokaryon incompatibility domain-containing protein n=1 Tax=Colletotrichum shisoi TaxID=2078593 RepID=A0A5Q4BDD6_9PEZI|nr:hypothetical protein CSHISOI_10507 [Colletotrichum shisoi]
MPRRRRYGAPLEHTSPSSTPPACPRTVADAVACCRRLGLPHLWIDVLCIFQNDDDEKLSESSPRSGGAPVDVKLVPSSRGLLNPSTLVQLKGQRPKPAKSSEPLHSRGWTFQETACAAGELSPREYFTATELRELLPSLSLADPEPNGDLGQSPRRQQHLCRRRVALEHQGRRSRRLAPPPHTLRDRPLPAAYDRGRTAEIPSRLSFDGSVRFDMIWSVFHRGMVRLVDDVGCRVSILQLPQTDAVGRVSGRPLRLRGVVKKGRRGRGPEVWLGDRLCYDSCVWTGIDGAYTKMMTERAALSYQIGQASFDDFAEPPGDKRPLRNSFDIGEDFDTSPALLDCVLVSTVGDLRGQPVTAGKPRG